MSRILTSTRYLIIIPLLALLWLPLLSLWLADST